MMVSQDLGLIEFTPLGYLQVKVGGWECARQV